MVRGSSGPAIAGIVGGIALAGAAGAALISVSVMQMRQKRQLAAQREQYEKKLRQTLKRWLVLVGRGLVPADCSPGELIDTYIQSIELASFISSLAVASSAAISISSCNSADTENLRRRLEDCFPIVSNESEQQTYWKEILPEGSQGEEISTLQLQSSAVRFSLEFLLRSGALPNFYDSLEERGRADDSSALKLAMTRLTKILRDQKFADLQTAAAAFLSQQICDMRTLPLKNTNGASLHSVLTAQIEDFFSPPGGGISPTIKALLLMPEADVVYETV